MLHVQEHRLQYMLEGLASVASLRRLSAFRCFDKQCTYRIHLEPRFF